MDKWDWFFGWAGVAGILLAIPLSILGNLLTPKVRAWWATTSERRRKQRITYLHGRLETLAEPVSLGLQIEFLALGLSNLAKAFIGMWGSMVLVFIVWLDPIKRLTPNLLPIIHIHLDGPLAVLAISVAFFLYLVLLFGLMRIGTYFTIALAIFNDASTVRRKRAMIRIQKELTKLGDNSVALVINEPNSDS